MTSKDYISICHKERPSDFQSFFLKVGHKYRVKFIATLVGGGDYYHVSNIGDNEYVLTLSERQIGDYLYTYQGMRDLRINQILNSGY